MSVIIRTNLKNLSHPHEIISPVLTHGEPRKILTAALKEFTSGVCLIEAVFVGRRLVTLDNVELLNGRRHRIFYALKKNNRIYIKFLWHKIKYLTSTELAHLKLEWDSNFFNNQGRYLIEKSGGIFSFHHFLYTKTLIKI